MDHHQLAERIEQLSLTATLRDALSGAGVQEAWLVGGLVRDFARDREPGVENAPLDLDVALPVSDEATARAVAKAFDATAFLLDEEHGAWRVFDGEAVTVDLVAYRAPTLQQDLAARDYTVNAVAYDLLGGRGVVDPLGGLDHLEAGVLRFCSATSLTEDPLRLLRAYRFMAVLGLELEAALSVQLKQVAPRLIEISPERIRDEWFKLLGGPQAGRALRAMIAAEVLGELFPATRGWISFDQGEHHDHSLMEHSLRCVEGVERMAAGLCEDADELTLPQPDRVAAHLAEVHEQSVTRLALLKFAALMHDAGKPETLRMEGENHRFFGHESRSAELLGEMGANLRLGKKTTRAAQTLAAGHMRMFSLSSQVEPTRRSRLRYLRDLGECAPESVLLTLADELATGDRPERFASLLETGRELLGLYWETLDHEPVELLVRGRDLVELLGVKEGAAVGRILAAVAEAERNGEVADREEALALARELAQESASRSS